MFVKRTFNNSDTSSSEQTKIRVMQWNILAQTLAIGSFDRVPNELLSWEYREPLIVEHILEVNPDVICLEEVDKFENLMQKLSHAYEGTFVLKPEGFMGCAILWNKTRIQKVTEIAYGCYVDENGKNESQIYIYGQFRKQEVEFTLVATHLKAKPPFEEVRARQVQQLLEKFTSEPRLIICGDFNDVPTSIPITLMKSKLQSCNEEAHGGSEPEFSTMKFREKEGMVKRVIDYVFKRNSEFKVVGYLALPASNEIDQEMGNPCKNHPSDHYSLVFDFKQIL